MQGPAINKPKRRQGRLTLLLIFSPVWLPLAALGVALLLHITLSGKTIELKRGNVVHEWLLSEPLKSYPMDLVPGKVRFYCWFGENSERHSVTVDVAGWRPEYRGRCLDWLKSRGLEKQSPGSLNEGDLIEGEGMRGRWSLEERVDGGAEMRIDLARW